MSIQILNLSFFPYKFFHVSKGKNKRGREIDRNVFHRVFGDKKSKTGRVPKFTDFLLLCAIKGAFFSTAKGAPHEWWRSMGNGLD